MEVEKNVVLNIDAAELLANIPDNSIDLMFLDPDYQDWKKLIDSGLIEECVRCIKPSGNILCFTKQPFDYDLRISVNPWFRREIYWTFENGGAWVSKRMPLVSGQKIYWLVKDKSFYFDPRTGIPYNSKTRNFERKNKVFGGYRENGRAFKKSENGVWLRDHLHYNKPNTKEIPSKPKELINVLLKCYCPSRGIVCDPFCGGGTIPIAAKNAGIDFYASEINQERAKQVNDSIKRTYRQTTIFDFIDVR